MKSQDILRGLLILLFSYAVLSKLLDTETFKKQMLNQVFPPGFNHWLVFLVPVSEIGAVTLLCFQRTAWAGFLTSGILMAAFTAYIALVLLHFWKRVPCSCGGVLGKMGWGPHLVFNVIFLLVALSGAWLSHQERRYR